jgi:hypothetical protein
MLSQQSPIVKWLSLLTLNQASQVRTLVGEIFRIFAPHQKRLFLLSGRADALE